MNTDALFCRWIQKRKGHLLVLAIVTSVVWVLFLYLYHYRTLSVSEEHLQHELHTSNYVRSYIWDPVHLRRSYSDKKLSNVRNDSFGLVRDRPHISDHMKENSRANSAQNSSQFYAVIMPVPNTIQNDSHFRVQKDAIQQRQYSDIQDANNVANKLPEWLRYDPSVQQLLNQQNISRASPEDKLLRESWTKAKPVQTALKPVSEPLLASGHRPSGHFEDDVRHCADRYKQIVVSVIDSGFTNFAVNFQRLSVDAVGLRNFLFVCIDHEAVMLLQQQGIACSYYRKSATLQNFVSEKRRKKTTLPSEASDFGTVGYFHKSNAKTAVILDILKLGYAVLIIDADVVLFKNPFPYFNCTSCDIHFQMDREMYNSGFSYIRPVPASILLYETAWDLYVRYHKAHDQTYINLAIEKLNGNSRKAPVVQIHSLPHSLFQCGVYYFEHQHRMFQNKPPCLQCVMVHNNYMGTIAAKIYRFKENLMWTIDEDGYYSSSTARYITYGNPSDFGSNTMKFELEALKSALAIAVASGRLLILPSFHCCTECSDGSGSSSCSSPRFRCSLLSVLRISTFDRVFGNRYREHSFLKNSLVPDHIKHNISARPIFFNVSTRPELQQSVDKNLVEVVTVTNYTRGATLPEVVRWISAHKKTAVIRFHSLYGNAIDWESDPNFGSKLKHWLGIAFDCSQYEQWDRNMLNLAYMWPGKNARKNPASH